MENISLSMYSISNKISLEKIHLSNYAAYRLKNAVQAKKHFLLFLIFIYLFLNSCFVLIFYSKSKIY